MHGVPAVVYSFYQKAALAGLNKNSKMPTSLKKQKTDHLEVYSSNKNTIGNDSSKPWNV